MNIAAIRAYSQAAGMRPTLPARNANAVTDGFDIAGGRPTAGTDESVQTGISAGKPGIAPVFEVFTAGGTLRATPAQTGIMFDARG